MGIPKRLESAFPKTSDIPERFVLTEPLDQRMYLVNGQIRQWAGPVQEVYSPISIASEDECKPKQLGCYPLMTDTEAVDALDAAVAAYGNGRGEW